MARRIAPPPPLTKAELATIAQLEAHWRNVVGRNIRRLRSDAGWSQTHLAVRAHVNTGHLGQVELGRRAPTTDFITRLAFALGVAPMDFYSES